MPETDFREGSLAAEEGKGVCRKKFMRATQEKHAHVISCPGSLRLFGTLVRQQLPNATPEGNRGVVEWRFAIEVWTVVDERLKPTGNLKKEFLSPTSKKTD